jgi:hypothetical protein
MRRQRMVRRERMVILIWDFRDYIFYKVGILVLVPHLSSSFGFSSSLIYLAF